MNKTGTIVAALGAASLSAGCGEQIACVMQATRNVMATEHMVAEASLAAHYVAAALEAGRSSEEINATLALIAGETAVEEFWISDETGRVVFTSVPGVDFTFPTDPEAGTQAAPFARLLTGEETVVTQDPTPRELDEEVFMYVGVAGVDQPRIVQVGVRAFGNLEGCENVAVTSS